jgi:hypothetical protein
MTKVGKALNTCNCKIMIDPARVGGDHDVFLRGDDAGAKDTVKGLAAGFRVENDHRSRRYHRGPSWLPGRGQPDQPALGGAYAGARRIREAACLDNGHHSVAKRLPNFVLSEDELLTMTLHDLTGKALYSIGLQPA